MWFFLYVFSCRRSLEPTRKGSTLVGSRFCFINVCSADSCNFGVLMRGGALRVFLLLHLGHSPNYYIFSSFGEKIIQSGKRLAFINIITLLYFSLCSFLLCKISSISMHWFYNDKNSKFPLYNGH